ncbi:hypothetical protein [Puniceicoccus vermicola]|uniref:Uncharacterized protein n=1 Tax=Puniceicoccus vermicola TaxID=388746 RepID=A0A7X1E393_9BACT|nr:hypothetical protein [Puniceicoccus vermicola]MBC2600738.1 hypothetical protein [Puniceicoccus vermicola]
MILHYLAIDTVCAVLAWSLLADRLVGTGPHALSFAWTGAGVWLVYVADRWLDSLPGSTELKPGARHRFAARHRQSLGIAWIIVWSVSVASALVVLSGEILLAGTFVAALAIGYLLIIQRIPSKNESGKLRAGGGLAVGILVATAANLFPAIEGAASPWIKIIVWLLTAWAFFLQTRCTRLWEEGETIPWLWLLIFTIVGALAAIVLGEIPAAVAVVSLALCILVVDFLKIRDKVAVADWILALAGACGWITALMTGAWGG